MDDPNALATKADLAETEAELKADLAETKAELKATKAELKADLTALETRLNERHDMLRSEMQHMNDTLIERISDVETKVLQAFYTFAQSNQQRFMQVEGNTNALGSRVAALETRLLEVEKRLNMPPAA
jgi:hypothetical protein